MNILSLLRRRFTAALEGLTDDAADLALMVLPSQDPKFGDYQANCAMPLAKQLRQSPRDVAQTIVDRLDLDDFCQPCEIAGPGFINVRIRDEWLLEHLGQAARDCDRLGIAQVEQPETFVLDYSAPNVAKPMHVGHIRSTVIGQSLYRLYGFLGHRTISDNHIGDWGTQFGMIIFGYKNFLDDEAYRDNPVEELGRLYQLVNFLAAHQEARRVKLPELTAQVAKQKELVDRLATAPPSEDTKVQDKAAKTGRQAEARLQDLGKELATLEERLQSIESDPDFAALASAHPEIGLAALGETAKLHSGDEENLRLWHEFLPPCLEEIEKIYRRLGVSFDHTLGESFYHDRLPAIVDSLTERRLAVKSDGAMCVFFEGQTTPMIVQKKDGAYLYATTDLATIQYRMEEFQPTAILYVVDHRQSHHFDQLFATARLWGYDSVRFEHVSFGTVLGDDGRPFKTRSGDTVGLEGLIDEAVRRAHKIVSDNDDAKPVPNLTPDERQQIAEVVGIGALKYSDLAHNRVSDYVFSYDKMLAMKGNTATYMQYSYARARSIFTRGEVDVDALRSSGATLRFDHEAERTLGLELLRFAEALDRAATDARPNHLTAYLFDLAGRYSEFFEKCPVLKAESDEVRASRLLLCDLTARSLKQGLSLLGIEVVDKM